MEHRVTIAVTSGVADVRLARPDKLNALDDAMFAGLIEAGERLKADRAVRAVVLSGEGRAFCAGLDAGKFGRMGDGALARELVQQSHGPANHSQQAVLVWREVPAPVIAAVHGAAFGGGLQLALGCDLRYVAPDAQLSVMEIKWGLVPDMAGPQLMRRLVREDIARELTYTGRIVTGEEAGRIGLATRVIENPREAALATAREIAARSPDAVRAAKRLYNQVPYLSYADGLAAEAREQAALVGSPNQGEAVAANLEKREPRFTD